MNLLIIGGTGVLSTSVVNEALSKKIHVTCINRGNHLERIPKGVTLINADARNENIILSYLSGKSYDAVIDFICYNRSHVEYSYQLFKKYAKQYIFISTTCVYDTSFSGIKTEDSEKCLKSWDYSLNKWECEKYLIAEASKDKTPFTIVRPCVTYDNTRIPYGIMPSYGYHGTVIKRILNDKPIITWDGGTAKWNLMRVEDFAKGVVPLVGNENSYNQAYNISGDKAYSWMEILDVLGEVLMKKVITYNISSKEYKHFYPERAGEISSRALDAVISNEKIKSLVPDFTTNIDLLHGIKMTIDAYLQTDYQKGFDYRYDALQDRIIIAHAKRNGINVKRLNLNFIDYSKRGNLSDRYNYCLEKNRTKLFGKAFFFLDKVYRHFF